jgi:23S rRNA G2069 N7-methylase RlmK/C1962 C5-methylase RlmI
LHNFHFIQNIKQIMQPTILLKCKEAVVSALSLRGDHKVELSETARLFDGRADGIEQLFIDRYHRLALAHYLPQLNQDKKEEREATKLRQVLKELEGDFNELGVYTLYFKSHSHDARTNNRGAIDHRPLFGEAIEEEIITEGKLSLIIRPHGSLHAGLFTDMRQIRSQLSQLDKYFPAVKRVLNLFAFTGSLGIAAALGGARQVCHVDSSATVLDWAKKNWALNKPSQWEKEHGVMRFICDDCSKFLEREIKRLEKGGQKNDLVIIDPPSFGRSRSRTFSFKRDAAEILAKSLKITSQEGHVIFTTNSRNYTDCNISQIFQEVAAQVKWSIKKITRCLPSPLDFRSQAKDSIAMRGVVASGGALSDYRVEYTLDSA